MSHYNNYTNENKGVGSTNENERQTILLQNMLINEIRNNYYVIQLSKKQLKYKNGPFLLQPRSTIIKQRYIVNDSAYKYYSSYNYMEHGIIEYCCYNYNL